MPQAQLFLNACGFCSQFTRRLPNGFLKIVRSPPLLAKQRELFVHSRGLAKIGGQKLIVFKTLIRP